MSADQPNTDGFTPLEELSTIMLRMDPEGTAQRIIALEAQITLWEKCAQNLFEVLIDVKQTLDVVNLRSGRRPLGVGGDFEAACEAYRYLRPKVPNYRDYRDRVLMKTDGTNVHKVNGLIGIVMSNEERLARTGRVDYPGREADDAASRAAVERAEIEIKQLTGVSR